MQQSPALLEFGVTRKVLADINLHVDINDMCSVIQRIAGLWGTEYPIMILMNKGFVVLSVYFTYPKSAVCYLDLRIIEYFIFD